MRKITKAILGVSAAAVIAAAAMAPVIVKADDLTKSRPVYTNEQLNSKKVQDEIGNKIIMNSITNSQIGDERNFVAAKVAGANVSAWDDETIKVEAGKTYTVRLYVHNNNPNGEKAIATGVKTTVDMPQPAVVAKSHTIVGYIDSNAEHGRISDGVTFVSDDNVWLEFVNGSAVYDNNVGHFQLSDEIKHSGALVGYDKMDGRIPGCYKYSGVVTFNVKVNKANVGAKLSKVVRKKGEKTWSESVNAKVGDEVEYQIEFVNLYADQVKNVMIRDILPTNVEYVKDSTYLYNSNYKNGVKLADNTVATSGINIGDYNNQGNAYVRFTGKVVDKTLDCGSNQLVNWANATIKGTEVYKDDASVMVDKTCTPDTPDTPETPETPGTPGTPSIGDTPTEIVSTGPGTIVSGAIGAGAIVTSAGYYLASRKKLM